MSIQQVIHEENEHSHVVMAIFDEHTKRWHFTYSVFDGDELQYTVTTSAKSLFVACRQAEQVEFSVDSAYAAGKLMLPDMGDWSVEYFS